MTFVDRATLCILGWHVGPERSGALVQSLLAQTVPGERYYSDGHEGYRGVVYWPAEHRALLDKSETYSVEGDNAQLRHYLARLGRRSRCFSRCLMALRRAVKVWVYAWNRRQLYQRQYPHYPNHVMEFAYPGD